jgi:excisionase family DNA binding protein
MTKENITLPRCECPIMARVETLEQHMYGHKATNIPGIHPIMFGDGGERTGIVQDIRDIKWYGKLALWAIAIVGGSILIALGNLITMKMTGTPSAVNTQSVTVKADDSTKIDTAYYTTPQLAGLLGYSDREIQDRASKGEIPGAWKDGKAWRFDRPSVDAWLAANVAFTAKAATSANTDPAKDSTQN